MSIVQALKDVTAQLEAYDALIKSSSSIPPEKDKEMFAETKKMNMVFRQARFFIDRPDLCEDQKRLKESLNHAQNVYERVAQALKTCDTKPEQTTRALMKRKIEKIEDFSIPPQPNKMSRREISADYPLTMCNLPASIWLKIIGLLSDESRFVLRHVCKPLKQTIQLKRLADPVQESAFFSIIAPVKFFIQAAQQGHTKLLQWAGTAGITDWDSSVGVAAAENGRLETLQWLNANGCPWNEETCISAAENGHLEILKWARANGCPWDERTCDLAAENGHLEILQWAHANGCPWDEETCARAALNGYHEILKWARANGCPWDEVTCAVAAGNGHLEVLKWAMANDAPWNEALIRRNAMHTAVLNWLNHWPRIAFKD